MTEHCRIRHVCMPTETEKIGVSWKRERAHAFNLHILAYFCSSSFLVKMFLSAQNMLNFYFSLFICIFTFTSTFYPFPHFLFFHFSSIFDIYPVLSFSLSTTIILLLRHKWIIIPRFLIRRMHRYHLLRY